MGSGAIPFHGISRGTRARRSAFKAMTPRPNSFSKLAPAAEWRLTANNAGMASIPGRATYRNGPRKNTEETRNGRNPRFPVLSVFCPCLSVAGFRFDRMTRPESSSDQVGWVVTQQFSRSWVRTQPTLIRSRPLVCYPNENRCNGPTTSSLAFLEGSHLIDLSLPVHRCATEKDIVVGVLFVRRPGSRRGVAWSLPGEGLRKSGRGGRIRGPGRSRRRGRYGRPGGRTSWRG
jgi:hypothetical protein